MDLTIDLNLIFSNLSAFIGQPTHIMLWQFFYTVGWIPLVWVYLWGAKEAWMFYIQNQYAAKQKKILLAIDIPRGNLQSPKAVENIFSYLGGAHGSINLIENYWEGKFQLSFSFEIVSIDGYTQFIIRTPESYRNLIESAVYSQYPDAEITEIEDYVVGMPKHFPDEEWDIYGAEFIYAKPAAYPIKIYEEFMHQFGGEPEVYFRDPMAALMDLCSSLRYGEQLWYQIIVQPIDMIEWTKIGDAEVSKILKEKPKTEKGFLLKFVEWLGDLSEYIYEIWGGIDSSKEDKKDDALKMMNLKPKEKKQVEAIHNKISKQGFNCKVRFVYMAKKDVMNKPKVASGFVGYMKQFAALDLNNLKPDMKRTATSAHYFWKDYRLNTRKNNLITNYVSRDGGAGNSWQVMNTEELATLWHFPVETVVKAPLIQKAAGRRSEPPMTLPSDVLVKQEEPLDEIFLEAHEQFPSLERKGEKKINDSNQSARSEQAPSFEEENIFAAADKPDNGQASEPAPPENLPFL